MARDDGRFAQFDERMRRVRGGPGKDGAGDGEKGRGGRFGVGAQVGLELVAGVIGGALIGYGLDRWFETTPLLLIVFFFLGAAAGLWNAYKYIKRAGESWAGDGSKRDEGTGDG